jgi:hypothetical protein
MGSPPTLDPTWGRRPGLDRPEEDRELREQYGELLEHLQTPAAFGALRVSLS